MYSLNNVPATLSCYRCAWQGDLGNYYTCPVCSSSLRVTCEVPSYLPQGSVSEGLWRYRQFLPLPQFTNPVTLGEGGTALLRATRLAPSSKLFLKNETTNPTASFKDRPVSVASSAAFDLGLKGLVCASTGNTAVSIAAYAAQANLPAACIVPANTPATKLHQARLSGAKVLRVQGDYSDAYALAEKVAARSEWANLTSTYINPYMLEGDKTIAYEVFEQLGEEIPDWIIVPVGAGPLLSAIYKGFEELKSGVTKDPLPRMVAVQSEGCSPIVSAFESKDCNVYEWDGAVSTSVSSIADPLRGYPDDGNRTLSAVRASEGYAIAVSEKETYCALRALANSEGIFVEPGAAAAVAAYRTLSKRQIIGRTETAVTILTGHGLKDTEAFSFLDEELAPVLDLESAEGVENVLEV